MSPGVIVLLVIAGLTLAGGAGWALTVSRRRAAAARAAQAPPGGTGRILFPFTVDGLSARALEAALRLARAEDATLLPVFLASVPHHLPLDSALPRQSGAAVSSLEAVEQRAAAFGVPVEGRISRGRTARHALREATRSERFDRIVIAAAAPGAPGFHPGDIAWLLASAPGEIIALRPSALDPLLDDEYEAAPGERSTTAMPAAYV